MTTHGGPRRTTAREQAAGSREGIRINRHLATRGVASRRGADGLIAAGRVAVNGRPAVPGTLIDPERDRVTLDGRELPPALPLRTLMLNKPPGVVTTRSDPEGRPTVLELVDDPLGLRPVGRLDADSRGLLLLSSDGELIDRLTHPHFGIHKRYRVVVRGRVGPRVLRALQTGVELEDGPAVPVSARALEQVAGHDAVEVVMAEGRKREVRRLCAAVGLPVVDLMRTGLGPLELGRLREGTARSLRPVELRELYSAAGLPAPPRR